MTSPFPGMDPYLEGHYFYDFYSTLFFEFKRLLARPLMPDYIIEIANDYYLENENNIELKNINTNLEFIKNNYDEKKEPQPNKSSQPVFKANNLTEEELEIYGRRIRKIQIRKRKDEKLITEIHILTPLSKDSPNRNVYLNKIKKLQENNVHILEIDLLRHGQRTIDHIIVKCSHYLVKLIRANERTPVLWAFSVKQRLPVVPVPLVFPHADAVLDIGKAMDRAYEMSQYQYALKYGGEPPGVGFSEEDGEWVRKRVDEFFQVKK